jgi:hypothetical protein
MTFTIDPSANRIRSTIPEEEDDEDAATSRGGACCVIQPMVTRKRTRHRVQTEGFDELLPCNLMVNARRGFVQWYRQYVL